MASPSTVPIHSPPQLHSFQAKVVRISGLLATASALLFVRTWRPDLLYIWVLCIILLSLIIKMYLSANPPIYLVDFSCLKPPGHCRVPFAAFLENAAAFNVFQKDSIDFMSKVLHSSGTSEETYLPPPLHYIPPKTGHDDSISEVHMLLLPIIEDLLSKTKISPRDIGILIVNCSGFCPTPSLTSIIVNKFHLRSDIKTYNVSGMGCSAGTLAVDMAQHLLKVHRNTNALILSSEILSTGWYSGDLKPMLLLNCLFRMGSAAILLSNKPSAQHSAKYKLRQTLRSHFASNDDAYHIVFREEDAKGITGVMLNRESLKVAEHVIRTHVTAVSASILPLSEKLRHVFSLAMRKYLGKTWSVYVPNFKAVVQHYCLPTSGKMVIKEIGKGLKLGEAEMEAALMTFRRFGNQSASALWYELAYVEGKERVKQGDRVWQLGMGSGTKCNSVIWECIRPIKDQAQYGPWAGCIDKYPVSAD
uniref:3-ketoacyl-CoA synthase n=1 Tax=Kalanchoe fedtschenkoi TaxID=63787 RepID=A0A7N0TCI8_KALFE